MLKILKKLILLLLKPVLSSRLLFKGLIRRKWVAFVFHDVSLKPSRFSQEQGLNTPPAVFSKQIDLIHKHFQFLHLDDVLSGKFPQGRPGALVTFDDGYASFFSFVIPFLRERRIPSVLFANGEVFSGLPVMSGLIAGLTKERKSFRDYCVKVGVDPSRHPYLRLGPRNVSEYLKEYPLTENELLKIKNDCAEVVSETDLEHHSRDTLFCVGDHLYNHFNARILSNIELQEQCSKNRDIFSRFPNYRPVISATFGQFDKSLGDSFKKQGYKAVFGWNRGANLFGQNFFQRISLSDQATSECDFFFEINKSILRDWLARR